MHGMRMLLVMSGLDPFAIIRFQITHLLLLIQDIVIYLAIFITGRIAEEILGIWSDTL